MQKGYIGVCVCVCVCVNAQKSTVQQLTASLHKDFRQISRHLPVVPYTTVVCLLILPFFFQLFVLNSTNTIVPSVWPSIYWSNLLIEVLK